MIVIAAVIAVIAVDVQHVMIATLAMIVLRVNALTVKNVAPVTATKQWVPTALRWASVTRSSHAKSWEHLPTRVASAVKTSEPSRFSLITRSWSFQQAFLATFSTSLKTPVSVASSLSFVPIARVLPDVMIVKSVPLESLATNLEE
jgi:hypothetical protein